MEQAKNLAKRFREVILDGVWIANTNFKDQLSKLTYNQAISKIESLNTIVALSFHVNYYIAGILNVFEGGLLEIRDQYSFDMPTLNSQEEWEIQLNEMWINAEKLANFIEQLSDKKLDEPFVDEKYGSYQRNIEGMIEHCYYHLGQIVLINKMVQLQKIP